MDEPLLPDGQRRTQTICLLILSAVALGFSLQYLRPVLLPFVLALFLTMGVTPVMDFLQGRFRFPRGLAIVSTMGIALLILLTLGVLISAALSDVLEKKEMYMSQVDRMVTSLEQHLGEVLHAVDELFGADHSDQTEVSLAKDLSEELGSMRTKVMAAAGGAIGWAANSVLVLLSQGLLVMVFMMFLIVGHRMPDGSTANSLDSELRSRVNEYLRVKVAVSALTGTTTFIILRVIGIDLALVFGLMAFFLNFIPNIGSVVAVLLTLPVILLANPEEVGVVGKILAVVLPGLAQFSVGNFIEPRWMGKSLDLNPIAILMALIFWGVLWGPVGMLLSVPITAVLKMLLERSDLTRPVALLLSDAE